MGESDRFRGGGDGEAGGAGAEDDEIQHGRHLRGRLYGAAPAIDEGQITARSSATAQTLATSSRSSTSRSNSP
jgi:hypothetical protein